MDIMKMIEQKDLLSFSQTFNVQRNYLGDRLFPDVKTQHLNLNTAGKSKYIVKIKSGNSNANKKKEVNNATLIDKLLSHSKTKGKTDTVSYSSTCSSLNSLMKVFKPKNKK